MAKAARPYNICVCVCVLLQNITLIYSHIIRHLYYSDHHVETIAVDTTPQDGGQAAPPPGQ